MPRWAAIALFLGVALLVVGGAHYYLWVRLVRDVALPPPWHRALSAALAVLALSVPLALTGARLLPSQASRVAAWAGYVWIGIFFFLLMLVLGSDLVRGAARVVAHLLGDAPPADPERRLSISRLVAGGIGLVAGGASIEAVRSVMSKVRVKEIEVTLARLPRALDGFVIAQITDLHVGPTIRRKFVESVVETTNSIGADAVAITGDLVDGSVTELADQVAPLASLRAKHGAFFVTGNHEYYSGVGSWCAALEKMGIRVLRNERVVVGDEGASFDLAGVDDFQGKSYGRGHGPDFERALGGRDPTRECVLLAHQPKAARHADEYGVGLQLSGHTHGGQLFPWNIFVRLQQPVVSGLAKVGRAIVYVSNGTGYWGPPMRLGAPAEVTKIVLRAA